MDSTQLLSLLRRCIISKSFISGKLIHQKVITLGLQNNVVLNKNLINFYFSWQHFDSAKLIFRTIENPLDISLWNGLMAAYSKNHMFIETIELFGKLVQNPYLKPDDYTYPSVLKACGGLSEVNFGKMIHTQLIKAGFVLDVVVASTLVSMYAKCDRFEYAIKAFDEMSERDVASWNTVISCYYQDGQSEKALALYEKMISSGFEPNLVTLTIAISSCGRLLDLERGKKIHRELMQNGLVLDNFVGSALVDMYGKCGYLDAARDVFDHIKAKNIVAWNSMMSGCSLKGDSKSCLELFRRMSEEGIKPTMTTLSTILMSCSRSAQLKHGKFVHGYIIRNKIQADVFINSALIDLYFKCGSVTSAEDVFANTPKTSVVSWNVMIMGYVTSGNYFKALRLYNDMEEAGLRPDAVTFTSILPACSQLATLEIGREIHKSILEYKLQSDEIVMGALLDMYAKCGAVNEASVIFSQLAERDLVSWTSMITAYGSHGRASEALKLFGEMLLSITKPDGVTFLAVLSACGHSGLVDEAYYYFNLMISKYDISPRIEHYSCLIDLLGRAGKLHEAYEILMNTQDIKEDVGLLSTLFSACHLHRDREMGEKVGKLLIEKDPNDSSTYVVLSNMYASVNEWDEVRKVRRKMKELRLKKNPGCSWIEIGKKIEPFYVDDQTNPHAKMVYECLTVLNSHMEKDDEFLRT